MIIDLFYNQYLYWISGVQHFGCKTSAPEHSNLSKNFSLEFLDKENMSDFPFPCLFKVLWTSFLPIFSSSPKSRDYFPFCFFLSGLLSWNALIFVPFPSPSSPVPVAGLGMVPVPEHGTPVTLPGWLPEPADFPSSSWGCHGNSITLWIPRSLAVGRESLGHLWSSVDLWQPMSP